jgi:hypothetical protein
MIPREAARHTREAIALQPTEPFETHGSNNPVERAVMGGDVLAQ